MDGSEHLFQGGVSEGKKGEFHKVYLAKGKMISHIILCRLQSNARGNDFAKGACWASWVLRCVVIAITMSQAPTIIIPSK